MTEINKSVDDRSNEQTDAVNKLDIGALRTFAKAMGLNAGRDWTKEDFVRAIIAKGEQSSVGAVLNDENAPRPGYSRVVLHRETGAGHKNSPVQVGHNGQLYSIPRGVPVDVPSYVLGVLNDAEGKVMTEIEATNGPSSFVENVVKSYPYQVLATTPGNVKNTVDPRAAEAALRASCKDAIGRWPTDGEYKEWLRTRMNKA